MAEIIFKKLELKNKVKSIYYMMLLISKNFNFFIL